jgi:hypothetical protein
VCFDLGSGATGYGSGGDSVVRVLGLNNALQKIKYSADFTNIDSRVDELQKKIDILQKMVNQSDEKKDYCEVKTVVGSTSNPVIERKINPNAPLPNCGYYEPYTADEVSERNLNTEYAQRMFRDPSPLRKQY